MLGHKCKLKKHVQNLGYPLPLQMEAPKPPFSTRRLRNLTPILTAYIFGMKHDRPIDNWASVLTTRRGLLYRLKTAWTLVHKQLLIGRPFLPILRKFCISLHCRASHMHFRPQNSTKLCHKVAVNHRNKLM